MTTLLRCILLAVAALGAPAGDAPLDPPALFVQANGAYGEGRYADAAGAYERLVAAAPDSGYVWFNLGNSYLRQGRLGEAIAAYRRSEALLPRDSAVRANLEFARKSSQDAIDPSFAGGQASAVVRTLLFWHYGLSRGELAAAVALLNLLLWTLLAVRLYRRDAEILRWAVLVASVACVVLTASGAVRWLDPREVAVIKNAEVDVHSGTSRDTVVQFKLHAGTEVAWLEARGPWLRISLPDGKQGWVHEEDVTALTL